MQNNSGFYHIITYGCQMNEHDSEKLAGMLEEMGYKQTNVPDEADIIFFNTCTIRKKADQKVFGKLGSFKKLKQNKPDLIIGIGGCMMQLEENVDKIKKSFPYVDLVIGTHNIHQLPELVQQLKSGEQQAIEIWNREKGLIPDLPSQRKGDYKAWVSIIQGCNNFCSYCIVPHVRGRERSRPLDDIISEINKLIKQGIKEITLLGQNVNSYGQDLSQNINFSYLLKKVDQIPDLERIRYMTSHPRDFNEDLISTILETENICEHFHLPLQSGSTPVLKKMNRGYSGEEYRQLVNLIKKKIPDASITTDIIVGFPGETENNFKQTLEMVKDLQFDMAFTFKYSSRSGTPAAKMENKVPENVKDKRLQKLMSIQNKISKQRNLSLVGKTVEILVEGPSKNNPKTFCGRTRTNKLVIIPRDEKLLGEIVKVKINRVQSWTLFGEVV